MSIRVRYFASLKDSLGRAGDELELHNISTVAQIWQQANGGKPLPENVLTAVNMDYVDLDYRVQDGDEVAFFPPVTGG